MSRATFRPVLSALMVAVGVAHFANAEFFVSIMPDWVPLHRFMVYLSGAIEIGLGLALSYAPTQTRAAWGLIALYVAVFPANVHMALNPDLPLAGLPAWLPPPTPLSLWLRLPFQGLFIWWAWLYTRPLPLHEPAVAGRPTGAASKVE
jgi:uncharacterized membrane protein